jgi:sulfite reductase (NADPH) flavoprotein alpha-component
MLRTFHKLPGLLASVLIVVLALSGVILSTIPALEVAATPAAPAAQMTVAELASSVARHVSGVTDITRHASGSIVASFSTQTASGADLIDPNTGAVLGPYAPSGFVIWMTNLHRSLFMGNSGRWVTGFTAFAMIALCLSGAFMLAQRMGGWRQVFSRARGTTTQRLHVEVGRFAILGLLLSAFTGFWMSMANLQVISNGMDAQPAFPAAVNGGTPLPIGQLEALKSIPLSQLRDLTFPTDPSDVFTVSTSTGQGFVDQATGQMLSWLPHGLMRQIYETVYMLHTGQGFWSLGLLLGLAALCAPIMAATGMVVWWRRRRSLPRFAHNHTAHSSDTIILVGSDGNATWGFARTLHDALTAAGQRVHTGPMNSLGKHYPHAKRMFILTSTHGDGAAPASAKAFMARLEKIPHAPSFPVALLGFGDRQFPKFSQFGYDVAEALDTKLWNAMLPYDTIDRQSVQEFARWGRDVGERLGIDLTLLHQPEAPRARLLELVERVDYGDEVQAPTTVLRFMAPEGPKTLWQRIINRNGLPRFEAGDLVGILPPDSDMPRFYSLASSARDGFLEICVRKHPGGQCSGFLHSLEPGDQIAAFIKPNPDFRPSRGKAPVILIGAGTGIGPLAGFIRGNARARSMHLYFGGRDPRSDFLYRDELEGWLGERRLTTLTTAFSRIQDRAYVQDRIAEDAHALRKLIQKGAQIMVCGGRDMAEGVMESLESVIAPLGLSTVTLKAEGRYVEDVY